MKYFNKGSLHVKKYIIPSIFAITVITVSAFLLFMNEINISIRLKELKIRLHEMDQSERNIDHIGLIATYEIHKKIYDKSLTQDKADTIEQKINSQIAFGNDSPGAVSEKYRILSIPALWMINFNRAILGKKPLRVNPGPDEHRINLDLAYYYERNFIFKKAIELYEQTLADKNIDKSLKASILLHQGYCYALAGFNDKARENYSTIIDRYNQDINAITATVLLMYLEGFKAARDSVLVSSADPLLRSRDLVNLLAYQQALDILETAESSAKPKDLAFIKYYKARSFTGLGKPEKAAETHISLITQYPASEYAKLSNRRLFMSGARAGGDPVIKKISIEMNKRLKDPVLTSMITEYNKNKDPFPETGDLPKLDIPRDILKKAEAFVKEAGPLTDAIEYLIIETSDGNVFKGTVIEKGERHIAIQTSIGRIDVKKDRISKITVKK